LKVDNSPGSGPYPSHWVIDSRLPLHTIYRPIAAATEKLPVIIWGNSGCFKEGTFFANFLNDIASYGYLVIANGAPQTDPEKNIYAVEHATDSWASIDWITEIAGTSNYTDVNASKLAVAGQSCGGLEALNTTIERAAKITTTGMFNSGYLAKTDKPKLLTFTHPIAYFLGGTGDGKLKPPNLSYTSMYWQTSLVAYSNGESDYAYFPNNTKNFIWKGVQDVGHMATYNEKYGGDFSIAARQWFGWQLKGDQAAKQQLLTAKLAIADASGPWNVTYKGVVPA
jgi:Chlorophyllase